MYDTCYLIYVICVLAVRFELMPKFIYMYVFPLSFNNKQAMNVCLINEIIKDFLNNKTFEIYIKCFSYLCMEQKYSVKKLFKR